MMGRKQHMNPRIYRPEHQSSISRSERKRLRVQAWIQSNIWIKKFHSKPEVSE